ncbi:structural protein [Bacillus pumilus]|nr:structural protein [Bacillus pumilus]
MQCREKADKKHILGKDKVMVVVIQNHNDYICGPNLIPQHKVNGKWETIKTNSPNPLNPADKQYDEFGIKESLDNKKGTYRLRVNVERYDKHGNHVETVGTFYTSEFYVR